MYFTESLTENRNFMRLYRTGRNSAGPFVAVYCKKNNFGVNRLGITVSIKLGGAVIRNRIRRRIREAYRLHERELRRGYDIVIVARYRAAEAPYRTIEQAMIKAFGALKLMEEKE